MADARRLIGRDDELEALGGALERLGGGAGRAVAFVGEPGIGKSAVLGYAASLAQGANLPVWFDRARMPVDHPDIGRGVVILDDLHLLDDEQVPRVAALLRASASEQLLCLLAYRPRQLTSELAAVLARAASSGALEVRVLGQLTESQARELIGERADLAEVHGAALGNPLYLKAIGGGPEASAEAGAAILGELAGLSRSAMRTVRAAAVFGSSFDTELLATLEDREEAEILLALDELTQLDLVRQDESGSRFTLRHEAVREVVYQGIGPSKRAELHRRAADALAARSAPIGRRAHHVARAADPDRPESAATLIAAARDSLFASPAVAVGHLRAALTLVPEDGEQAYEARVLLAQARLMTGDAFEGRELLDALRAATTGSPGEVAALADSSRLERQVGRYSEAAAIARRGLAALADRDSATATALHIQLSDDAYDRRDFPASCQHAETAAEIARRHGDAVGQANALAQAALAHLFTGDLATAQARADAAAELIDASPDSSLLTNLEACLQLSSTDGMLGRFADAERHAARACVLSQKSGQTYIAARLLTVLGNAQRRSGRLGSALRTLDEVFLDVEANGAPAEQSISAMLLAELLFWRDGPGDAERMEQVAAYAVAVAASSTLSWAVAVRCFHAELVLLTGDAERARFLMLEAAGGPDLPRFTTWRAPRWCDALAGAAALLDDPAEVEKWASVAEQALRELPSPGRLGYALRARMRALVARGDVEGGLRSAQEAIEDFATSGDRVELARTLLAAVTISLDAGLDRDVRSRLSHAALLAEQCGAARLAEDAARLSARHAAATTARDSDTREALTAREKEIAELVSTGMTNSAIAESLFLSVRTVETHLRQVYRKLGVTNRAGMAWTLLNRREGREGG